MASFFEDESRQCNVVPLIVCKGDQYSVDEETLQWIEAHASPFAVVACAGRYRTGKSFLLNRLANANSGTGFGVGDTVQACTKGLWVYKHFFKTDTDKDVLFVDTEGIDALDADDTHDVRIFTLALLLSSAFMYNSVGAIDETAMQTLSLMTRVTENVRVHAADDSSTPDQLAEHMPQFFWVLRDFALRLIDRQGTTITPDEYLEEALQTTDPQRDHIRGMIRKAFGNRALITLPRPSSVEQDANYLEDRLFSVSPRFTSGVDALRQRLFSESKPFSSQSKPVSGRMYAMLCRHLASVVQTNAVPVIRDSWSLMASVQNRDLRDACVAQFNERTRSMTKKPAHVIDDALDRLRDEILENFDKRALQPVDDDVRRKLLQEIFCLAEEARRRLAKDLVEDIVVLLDEIEPNAFAEPTRISTLIADAEMRFLEDFGRDANTTQAWKAAVTERATRWLPRIVCAYESAREQTQMDLDTTNERIASLEREIEVVCQAGAKEFNVRTGELEQRLESKDVEIETLHTQIRTMQEDAIAMEARLHSQATELERIQTELHASPMVPEPKESVDADAIDAANLELVRLQTELRGEQHANAGLQKKVNELNQRLETANVLHSKLQENWTRGLEELRQSEQQMREGMEQRIHQHKDAQDRLRLQLDDVRQTNNAMKERVASLQHKASTDGEIHDREKQQLREVAQRHREQCETAQERVLQIHKSMLEDLRVRDERSREQQSVYLKERAEFQTKAADLSRENERTKEALSALKRRNNELEGMERDCKRLKMQHQEHSMIITRLEAENAQIKSMCDNMGDERERLRQENMQMEGELAVLRAEKQLADARRAMST